MNMSDQRVAVMAESDDCTSGEHLRYVGSQIFSSVNHSCFC